MVIQIMNTEKKKKQPPANHRQACIRLSHEFLNGIKNSKNKKTLFD
jgi:hypothetical protein